MSGYRERLREDLQSIYDQMRALGLSESAAYAAAIGREGAADAHADPLAGEVERYRKLAPGLSEAGARRAAIGRGTETEARERLREREDPGEGGGASESRSIRALSEQSLARLEEQSGLSRPHAEQVDLRALRRWSPRFARLVEHELAQGRAYLDAVEAAEAAANGSPAGPTGSPSASASGGGGGAAPASSGRTPVDITEEAEDPLGADESYWRGLGLDESAAKRAARGM